MKTIFLALSVLAMSSAFAGPSVSGGIAYYKQFEVCKFNKEKAYFSIAAVLKPGNIVSSILEGENSTSLNCTETKGAISTQTGEEMIWKCEEQRAGEGQLRVHVLRANDGVKYAIVYRLDIINRLSPIYKMKCDQQVSN